MPALRLVRNAIPAPPGASLRRPGQSPGRPVPVGWLVRASQPGTELTGESGTSDHLNQHLKMPGQASARVVHSSSSKLTGHPTGPPGGLNRPQGQVPDLQDSPEPSCTTKQAIPARLCGSCAQPGRLVRQQRVVRQQRAASRVVTPRPQNALRVGIRSW